MSNPTVQNNHETSYMSLTKGLRELDLRGPYVPSDLLLIGDHAFPLAMNSKGQVLMAASLYGRGRIVVLGHEGYLTAFPALVENALIWLRGDGSDNPSVAVHQNMKVVSDNLSSSTFQVEVVGGFSSNLKSGVYVTDAYSVGANPKDLVAFLKAGGGVLLGGQAWSWAADHPKENTLHYFDGNKVSGVAGIYFSKNQGEAEHLPVYPQIPSSWMAVVIGKDFEDDLQFLLHGVSELAIPNGSLASEVLVHGPLSFPIATAGGGPAFLAGAYYGQGRVIVAGHEGVLSAENNGIKIATDSGLEMEKTGFKKDLSVFVSPSNPNENWEEIQNFVAEGGGLLIGNKILNQMGLSLLKSTIKAGSYKVPDPIQVVKNTYHFRHLLHRFAKHVTVDEKLSKHEEEFLKKLGSDCSTYLNMKAHDSCHYSQVVATLTDILKKSGLPQVSTEQHILYMISEITLIIRYVLTVHTDDQWYDSITSYLSYFVLPR
ncbi:hypothetical protein XENOCAPTIV_014161 [Xenoophorus captivus]|uniref:Uncharacterized protein n=1 Tax=Xenoophorus captivus TaxID=1517983 RepID=A0ABV0S0F8_9TELE